MRFMFLHEATAGKHNKSNTTIYQYFGRIGKNINTPPSCVLLFISLLFFLCMTLYTTVLGEKERFKCDEKCVM